jgi:hypothetical protein
LDVGDRQIEEAERDQMERQGDSIANESNEIVHQFLGEVER